MLKIRKCLMALAIALAILTLSSVRYGNAASSPDVQNRVAGTTESCVCGGCLSMQWGWSDKTEDDYLQKWREEDRAYNAKWGLDY